MCLGERGQVDLGLTYLDQTAGLDEVRLAPANWTGFARSDLQAAAGAWRARATQERRSAAVFATICSGLAALELPLSVLAAVARIVADEVRHTAICRRLAAELGADAPDDDLSAAERRLRPPKTGVQEAAVSLLLVEGALGETISAAMFAATRAGAREPRTRSALSIILRDEVRHARTCWEILAVLPAAARLDPERLARDVSHELGVVEMTSVLPALKRVEAGDLGTPEDAELGLLPPLKRAEVFYAILERTIFRRLRPLGINGPSAWAARYRPSA